ncbi:MAG: hypothetical protein ACLU37_11975 [Collinsella sp.]
MCAIRSGAIEAAANLSNRYIQDRFLPDRPSTSLTRPVPALELPRIARRAGARSRASHRGAQGRRAGGHRERRHEQSR